MQDRNRQTKKLLATHGRTIHSGQPASRGHRSSKSAPPQIAAATHASSHGSSAPITDIAEKSGRPVARRRRSVGDSDLRTPLRVDCGHRRRRAPFKNRRHQNLDALHLSVTYLLLRTRETILAFCSQRDRCKTPANPNGASKGFASCGQLSSTRARRRRWAWTRPPRLRTNAPARKSSGPEP